MLPIEMKRFLMFCVLLFALTGCTSAIVEDVVGYTSATTQLLDVITVAVQLSSLDSADNDAAFATLDGRYGVNVKPALNDFTDSAKALIDVAKSLRDEIAAGRAISEDSEFLNALNELLPENRMEENHAK